MSFINVFHKQTDHHHTIQSFLMALSFTTTLESRDVRDIVQGLVSRASGYISNLKMREYLQQKQRYLCLTKKALHAVSKIPVALIKNKMKGDVKIHHEIQLVRALFVCLLHLNFQDVLQIQKQKGNGTQYFHDLTIALKDYTLYVEIDTGTEPVKTLEAKIRGFKSANRTDTLIYFTSDKDIYTKLRHNPDQVQFIYLQSPTLSEDILQLTVEESKQTSPSQFHRQAANFMPTDFETPHDFTSFNDYYNSRSHRKLTPNVTVSDMSLVRHVPTSLLMEENLDLFEEEKRLNAIRIINSDEENEKFEDYQDFDNEEEEDYNNFDY